MIYFPRVKLNKDYINVEFTRDEDALCDFFVESITSTLPENIIFKTQKGITAKNINSLDYLEVYLNIPLFSERFVGACDDLLKGDMEFYTCKVDCDGREYSWFVGKSLVVADLVNSEASSFRGRPPNVMIEMPPVFNKNLPDFYFARDTEYRDTLIVSEKLRSVVESKKLAVDFYELRQA
ncbi:hypothetical protein P886_1007 [Alteromonadaceae bacterium 2753L.S.0a.02]|nr:hypothetical protein P886_1007 [Alteromonadaceae bacterium 2753L.S.0a.02]